MRALSRASSTAAGCSRNLRQLDAARDIWGRFGPPNARLDLNLRRLRRVFLVGDRLTCTWGNVDSRQRWPINPGRIVSAKPTVPPCLCSILSPYVFGSLIFASQVSPLIDDCPADGPPPRNARDLGEAGCYMAILRTAIRFAWQSCCVGPARSDVISQTHDREP
jgi:hypothetical protein